MNRNYNTLSAGTGRSVLVRYCQNCGGDDLHPILDLGYLPPVNTMNSIGSRPLEESFYPAELLECSDCSLVQLGTIVDPAVLFPDHYAYTSGTTKLLRDNFADLSVELNTHWPLTSDDLVVDIGSNDGTLLSNFSKHCRVCGIEPTAASAIALARGIPTIKAFFNSRSAHELVRDHGKAKVVTATNVFAHIEDVHGVTESILGMLRPDGLFVSESHYFLSLVQTLQYDTIYHEHLRYYSLRSLSSLFAGHDLEIVHARQISTHGGSIRVYAARRGQYPVTSDVGRLVALETSGLNRDSLKQFAERVAQSKLNLWALLQRCRLKGRVYAVGAPSRASTLINYVGVDHTIVDCVLEIAGSYKIGRYMPGKRIPVVEEARLFVDQPAFALLLSWHIADELIGKLRAGGYAGKFIVPLPEPRIVG
jgi:hypothetical protein